MYNKKSKYFFDFLELRSKSYFFVIFLYVSQFFGTTFVYSIASAQSVAQAVFDILTKKSSCYLNHDSYLSRGDIAFKIYLVTIKKKV